MFGLWDWLVVGLYFASMAWIGIHFSRRNRNFSDYMFGGGALPWFAVGISLIATSVSATTFLGNPADAFANDMRLLMLGFGSLTAILVIGFVFIPRFRSSGVQSAYELLEVTFSRPVRIMAAAFYSGHLLLRIGILIYGPSLVLEKILGVPLWVSILVMSFMAILYTYHGGIKAVTWTDVVQFGVFFGSGVAAIIFIADAVGSFGETWALAAEAGKTRWFSMEWNPASDRNFISAGLVYIVFEVAIRGCDQQFVQRYLSCKNVREANYSSIVSAILGVFISLIFFTLGAFLYVYFKVKMVEMLPEMNVNEIFPYFILNVLPTGLKGLLVAAILAAAMSSLSSAYSALSNTTVVDFLRHKAGAEEIRFASAKLWVLIWGGLGTLAAFLSMLGNISLLTKALFFTSLFTGPLLGIFLLAFFRPRTSPGAVIGGTILGMISLLFFVDIPILPAGVWTPLHRFAWPWNPLISLTGGILFTLLLDFIHPRKSGISLSEKATHAQRA